MKIQNLITIAGKYLMTITLLMSVLPTYGQIDDTINIIIVDKKSKEPLAGTIVRSGHSGASADASGRCTLYKSQSNIKNNTILLSISLIGYSPIKDKSFPLPKGNNPIVISLSEDAELLKEVIVQGIKKETTRLQQTVTIDSKTLERSTSLSVGKMLEQVPGVSTISTGGTIAKPVIQGMHSSRILLINNGVRLESQSWGDDHAPEIDHTGATTVEVIKGAEAVRYGYGAMGGVVLFNQAALPYGHDKFRLTGKIDLGYASNGRAPSASSSIEMGYKHFGLRLHGMYQRSGDYSTSEYILNNTGYKNISLSGHIGYKNQIITASLYASLYTSRSGIYFASKISDIDQLLTRFEIGRPDHSLLRPFSSTIEPPMQQTQHVTLKGDVAWEINPNHNLELKVSYQDNLRQEFENRKKAEFSLIPVQDLMLTTFTGDLSWKARWKVLGMSTTAGTSWMYQYNYNIPGTKQPAFIPNFTALTMGGYIIHKLQLNNLLLSAGIRYDYRAQAVSGYSSLSSYRYYDDFSTHRNFTGTIAAHYQVNDNLDFRTNLGWSWRPPDINELYATGLNHGTYWVVGNKNLTSEKGYKVVLGTTYHNSWLSIEPNFFFQNINNYIYDSIGKGNERFHNHPSGKYPKFIYGQDDARFLGGDIIATVSPLPDLKVSTKGEWISARNITQNSWLPYMPSDRYSLGAEYQFKLSKDNKWSAHLYIEGNYVSKQRRFDPSKDLVPDSPPAYFLMNSNAEVHHELNNGRRITFMIIGDNILNTLYKEYTDRFRFYAHARGAQFTFKTLIGF